ncbi:MAG: extracellular solute-binding protein [Chloroflexi bacterium]|nr:extracellular solute-binding protein [Chloroflexota bacterium]
MIERELDHVADSGAAEQSWRRSRRRLFRSAAGLASAGGAVVGACIPSGSPAPPARDAKLPPARLSVHVGGSQDSLNLLQERLFPAFTALHPGVTIDFLTGGMPLDKLRTLAAGGETPEIYMNGAAFAPAIAEGKLAIPLDDRIKAWGKLGDFFATSLHASSWAGKQWGLPMMVANRTRLWRKNVLQEAGISKTPATWDEVVDATRRSTKVDGGTIVREGNVKPDGWTYFVASMLSVGKTLFRDGKAEFAGAEGVTAMEYMLDVYRGTRPPGAAPPAGSDGNRFATGVLAHTWANMTSVREVEKAAPQDLDQLVIGDPAVPGAGKYRMPASAKIRPISPNFSDWICIGALSKYQDHAWELMKFLLEPDNLLAYCETRFFQPPRKSIANQGFMRKPHLQRMVEVFDKYGHAQIRVPDQAIFIKVMQEMGNNVYDGKMSPKQAVEDAARQLQVETDRLGYKGTTL